MAATIPVLDTTIRRGSLATNMEDQPLIHDQCRRGSLARSVNAMEEQLFKDLCEPCKIKMDDADEVPNCSDFTFRTFNGAILATVAGYVNANMKRRYDLYGGFMTGNSIAFGSELAAGRWDVAAIHGSLIGFFFLGSLLGWVFEPVAWRRAGIGSFRVLAIFALLITIAVEANVSMYQDTRRRKQWGITPIGFVLGMIDLICFKGSSVQQHVTFMTGNLQKIAGYVYGVLSLANSKPVASPNSKVLLAPDSNLPVFWICFLSGAALGTYVTLYFPYTDWQLLPAIGVAVLLICINEGPASVN